MDQSIRIMIRRYITNQLQRNIKKQNVTVLFGPRRTGKTTLMNSIASKLANKKTLIVNGEDYDIATILSSQKEQVLKSLVSGYDVLFIDEAQNIPRIGQNLKLLVDTNPDISVFATGSASFDLRNKLGEPLTGRSRFFTLYPFAVNEIFKDYLTAYKNLDNLLIYGSYPQVFLENNLTEKRHILENIKNGYLLKDLLQLENIKDSLFVMNLLKLIAFQIGNDISLNELSKNLQTTVKTVKRYLEILEKTFVIFKLTGFSSNLRKEIGKSSRYYFWDNGIRNAVISNFSTIDLRNDAGKLWENFCISERIKKQRYLESFSEFYFWRTYDKQEIDLIEINNGNINAFEFKWSDKSIKVPVAFKKNYHNASFTVINRDNFFDFLKLQNPVTS